MRNILLLILLATACIGVAAEPPSQCSLSLVRAQKTEMLGEFTAKVAEESETIKTYAIPGTNLKAKISVFYTDESVRLEIAPKYVQDTSIQIAVAVKDKDDDSVLTSPEASIGEAAIVSQTQEKNLLRVSKVGTSTQGRFAIVGECRNK